MILTALIAAQVSFFSQAITAFADENSEHDNWITNQAILALEQQEKDQKQRDWDVLTAEQKYNKSYYNYVQDLEQYYEQFNVLKQLEVSSSSEDITKRINTLKDSIVKLRENVLTLNPDQNYLYTKNYINNSISYLEAALGKLSTYDLYNRTLNKADETKITEKEINEQIAKFNENFSKAYKYSITSKGNDFKYNNNVNKNEEEAYNLLNKYYPKCEEYYNNLTAAYDSLTKGKYSNDLMQKVAKQLESLPPLYINKGGTDLYREIYYKISDIKDTQATAYDQIKLYSYNLTTSAKDRDKLDEALAKFKTQLEDLKTEYNKIQNGGNAVKEVTSEKIDYGKLAELKDAQDKGYNSIEEYQAALEKQQKSTTKYKAEEEKDKIDAEVKRLEDQKKLDIEKTQDRWNYEKIDFSEGQAAQSHDKAFYMEQAEKNLRKYSIMNDNTRSIILQMESEAYDAMWDAVNSGNADKQLMQNLYDQYPDDFMTIMFYYNLSLQK